MRRREFLAASAGAAAGTLAQLAAIRRTAASALTADGGPEDVASQYSVAPGLKYFNHASIGTQPVAVRRARSARLALCETNPWLHVWGGAWEEDLTNARDSAARVLGADADDVAFLRSTTEAFNILASGLALGPGDEVLFSSLNHIGASACWRRWSATLGYSVRRFEMPLDEAPDLRQEDLVELHMEQLRDATKVLVLPHMDNRVGLRHPVAAIARRARERGVRFVLVDAAQTVGMLPVDVGSMGCDALATSAHKWLQAPKGTGLFWTAPALRERLAPMTVTWGQTRWTGTSRVYEDIGTRDPTLDIALGEACAFNQRTPSPTRVAKLRQLWTALRDRANALPGVRWRSPREFDRGGALVSLTVERAPSAEAVFEKLRPQGFVFRPFDEPGFSAIRISFNLLNSEEQIDALTRALAKLAL